MRWEVSIWWPLLVNPHVKDQELQFVVSPYALRHLLLMSGRGVYATQPQELYSFLPSGLILGDDGERLGPDPYAVLEPEDTKVLKGRPDAREKPLDAALVADLRLGDELLEERFFRLLPCLARVIAHREPPLEESRFYEAESLNGSIRRSFLGGFHCKHGMSNE